VLANGEKKVLLVSIHERDRQTDRRTDGQTDGPHDGIGRGAALIHGEP